jgi:hypothetical protein
MIDITKLSPDRRRGYVAAREFIFSQMFFWLGSLIGITHYTLSNSWAQNITESALVGFAFSLLYVPFLYVRAVLKAWRVWRGHDEPEEITEAQEKARAEAIAKSLEKLSGGHGE